MSRSVTDRKQTVGSLCCIRTILMLIGVVALITFAGGSVAAQSPSGPGDVTGNGQPAQDLNGDGLYEDVNGDGVVDMIDMDHLIRIENTLNSNSNLVKYFDWNADGQLSPKDFSAFNNYLRKSISSNSVAVGGSGADIEVSPRSQTVAPLQSTTFDITVSSTPRNIDIYEYIVRVSDSNAKITDVQFGPRDSNYYSTSDGNSDRTAYRIAGTGAKPSGNQTVIGTITLTGTSVGTSDISVEMLTLGDSNNSDVSVSSVTNASVQIAGTSGGSGSSQVVTFENSQQTVTPGGTTTYDVILTDAPNGVSSYSFELSSGDAATAEFTDFSFAGSPSPSTRQVSYGSNNATLTVTGSLASISAGSNVTLGTVTVQGNNVGSTTLGVSVNSLLDSNNGRITIAGVRGGQVSVTGGPSALPGQSQAPTDQDNDGVYEDVNGDGTADLRDLQPFFNLVRPSASPPSNPSFFDINNDGNADLADLQPFFNEISP